MNTGKLGEEVVAQWISERGGEILERRWRWQRGEIDLIAIDRDTLLFIEVKTRNKSNLDADGLLAITPQKQAKIVSTAQLFLVKHPHLADYPCRFDVAIVRHQPPTRAIVGNPLFSMTDFDSGECLLLLDYLAGAFDAG
ncbi:YraN family protein [Chamaesiphon sp. GL140_3_metabinner_50]|uniref:YraN family protein n=1 Tax=Chamaesiphon sp. GL140_3_metabinner_50 TaxID=2970812 RepID=UPI0025D755E7|nr:YraN family protein [Chamaesiphon sp. GL140_3_metabinner_50]